MARSSIVDLFESGERARLIPVCAARQKAIPAVSAVLAVFRIVPEYARAMLEEVGALLSRQYLV